MNNFFKIILLISLYSFSSFAKTTWTRHVLTEARDDGAQLLLVLDVPSDPKLLQNVVYRRIFNMNQKAQLEEQKNLFLSHKIIPTELDESEIIDAPLWPLKQNFWTWEDEKNFSKWVETVDTNILNHSGIKVDCADFYVALRWIYSHDNNLPVGNKLAVTNVLFGSWQSTEKWNALPYDKYWKHDRRFIAALRYLLKNSYTHTLIKDVYPVGLNKDFLLSGSVQISLKGSSGHTEPFIVVGQNSQCVGDDGCIVSVWGNEPPSEKVYRSTPRLGHYKSPEDGGIFRYRWPELTDKGWALISADKMPGYSLEQYEYTQLKYSEYVALVYEKLGMGNNAVSRAIEKGMAIEQILLLRLKVTALGSFVCHFQSCPEGSELYELYSTPGRDQRIREIQQEFKKLLSKVNKKDVRWRKFMEDIEYGYLFELGEKRYGTLKDYIFDTNLWKKVSSDPNDDFRKKWGLNIKKFPQDRSILEAFEIAWAERKLLVDEAQNSCNEEACSEDLNTDLIDKGMRAAYVVIKSLDVNPKLELLSKSVSLKIPFCDWNTASGGVCSLYDYIYSDKDLINKMSSNPHASYKSRFGFE